MRARPQTRGPTLAPRPLLTRLTALFPKRGGLVGSHRLPCHSVEVNNIFGRADALAAGNKVKGIVMVEVALEAGVLVLGDGRGITTAAAICPIAASSGRSRRGARIGNSRGPIRGGTTGAVLLLFILTPKPSCVLLSGSDEVDGCRSALPIARK